MSGLGSNAMWGDLIRGLSRGREWTPAHLDSLLYLSAIRTRWSIGCPTASKWIDADVRVDLWRATAWCATERKEGMCASESSWVCEPCQVLSSAHNRITSLCRRPRSESHYRYVAAVKSQHVRTGLAQLVERTALNRVVKGSIPLAGGSSFLFLFFYSTTEHPLIQQRACNNPWSRPYTRAVL